MPDDVFDWMGRPVVYEALRGEQAAPTLTGIRNIFSVIDDSVALTPQKAIAILRTAEFGDPWLYLELAERMIEKDLLFQGCLHTRTMAVSQLDIDVQPATDDKEGLADAAFIRDILIDSNALDLHETITEMMDALSKGYSATEIIWNTDGINQRMGGPAWLPWQLKWRDPRWFLFDWISGEQLLVRTLKTDGPQLPVGRDSWDSRLSPINFRVRETFGHQVGIQPASSPLAPFKFIVHIAKQKAGLPIRGGLARLAIWTYIFKNYVLKDWVTFAEVYGQPMRLGKYGPGATENDKSVLLRAVANIGTDTAAIIPESMAIEYVESKGGGQKSHEMYQKFCEYLDKLLTIGVLGQELTTQLPRGAGSRAAAQVHDVVRRDIATDDAKRIAATLNRDLVRPLIDLNRGPRHKYPLITIDFAQTEDLAQDTANLTALSDHEVPIPISWVREKYGIPERQGDEPIMQPKRSITVKEGDGGMPATPVPEKLPEHAPEPGGAIGDANLSPEYTDVNGHRNGTRNDFAGRKKTLTFLKGGALLEATETAAEKKSATRPPSTTWDRY